MYGPSAGGPGDLVRPPLAWLVAAFVGVVVTFVLFGWDQNATNAVGYAVGCVGVITCVMIYRIKDQTRRQEPTYSPASGAELLAIALLVVGVAGSVAHLWLLATELSK